MTRLGFKALYGSGWQLAATKSMYPGHRGLPLAPDGRARVTRCGRASRAPGTPTGTTPRARSCCRCRPTFVDMEAGFGGPTQTFTLATELIRAGAAGVHLREPGPANRTCGHIVNVGKAEAGQGAGASGRLARQAQGHQGRLPGHRGGRRHHRAHRLDRRRAARAVVGRREDGGRGCLGSGRAGRAT